jgi:flagellar hook-associated protein 2
LTTFKANVSALEDDTLYQERTVSGSNSGVSVTAEAGVGIQSFSVDVTTLAKNSVLQSGAFTTKSASVATGAGTLNLNIGGTNYAIDYDASTTLDDIKEEINNVASDDVTATILQTGESAYSLVVTSKETGKEQMVSLTDLDGNIDTKLVSDAQVSGTFNSASAVVGSNAGQMNVNINGMDYAIDYTASTTLQGLADAINADASLSGVVNASVVEYGANDYRLVMTPKESVQDQAITVTDLGTGLDANLLNAAGTSVSGDMQVVQDAVDASFKYNGIEMTRSTNTVTDITLGMTLNLLQEGESASISITQNVQKVSDELKAMVTSYNTLMGELDDMTLSDLDEGKVGIFNGDNTIKSIGREITRTLTSVSSDGFSLAQFGIGLNEDGTMTFDSTDFTAKFNEDPDAAEAYFSSSIDSGDEEDGVFTTLNTIMDRFAGFGGLMTTLTTASNDSMTSLQEEHTRALDFLNSRYDALTARFVAYDSIISRLNSQFSALQQQIEMAVNAKN